MRVTMLLSLELCIFVSITEGANILFLTPMASKSHKIFYMGIVSALAENGHNVTILSAFKNSKEIKNVNDLAVPDLDFLSNSNFLSDAFEDYGAFRIYKTLVLNCPYVCNDGLALQQVQNLKKDKFDLIILSMFYDYCYLSLIHHFQVPFLFVSPLGLQYGSYAEISGSLHYSSFVANKLLDANFPLTFFERILTLVTNALLSIVTRFYIYPRTEAICKDKGLCPPDMPTFSNFHQNASLFILNSIRGLENPPRPSNPNVIYAGGAHLLPGTPLSMDFENWIQAAEESGFIYFSIGSAMKPANLPERHRRTLIKVFGSLPQRVLWRWDEETMPDLPSNVRLCKWLPQQDILAHDKAKLFITHGGLLSTFEATYHGVPLIGMPLFSDQFSNMREAESEGWTKLLYWRDLTESSLREAISEIINNSSYTEIVKKRSLIMKDLPMHPAKEASFWIEFVLRHGGAKHMTSPLFQMAWYELHNIDIWATFMSMACIILWLNYLIIKRLLRYYFLNGKLRSKNKKKRE